MSTPPSWCRLPFLPCPTPQIMVEVLWVTALLWSWRATVMVLTACISKMNTLQKCSGKAWVAVIRAHNMRPDQSLVKHQTWLVRCWRTVGQLCCEGSCWPLSSQESVPLTRGRRRAFSSDCKAKPPPLHSCLDVATAFEANYWPDKNPWLTLNLWLWTLLRFFMTSVMAVLAVRYSFPHLLSEKVARLLSSHCKKRLMEKESENYEEGRGIFPSWGSKCNKLILLMQGWKKLNLTAG